MYMSAAPQQEPNLVAILAGDARMRQEIAGTLLSFYRTIPYETADRVLADMAKTRPDALIVADPLPPDGAYAFIRALRRNPVYRDWPVVLIVGEYNLNNRDQIHSCGASSWLVKPFRRMHLVKTLARLVNGGVEKQWETLPPLQKKVLNLTVKIFDNISAKLYKGEPISMTAVDDACQPLIEAIHTNNHKLILDSVLGHDNFTYVHSLRVATMLGIFAYAIGLPVEDQILLASGGLLHDVGKMYVPFEILNKPGKLTPEEYEVMKKHVLYTTRYLNSCQTVSRGVRIIAEQHHERLDGSGYPNGLKGGELNDLARMAAIVDVFCALTERRPYKKALSAEASLDLMHAEMAGKLDGLLLDKFRDMLIDAVSGHIAPPVVTE